MGKVIANASMSLDGYIAKHDNTIGHLFDWFTAGDIEWRSTTSDITFRLTQRSAEYWHSWVDSLGALVCGRTLFDVTDGWGGHHTMNDVPVVVVTHHEPADWIAAHPDAPFTFVHDVSAAVQTAQEIAGDRIVAVTAGMIAGQCVELGLLDEVAIDLVPVIFGEGRPFFGHLTGEVPLGDATTCIAAERVTHLVHPVRR